MVMAGDLALHYWYNGGVTPDDEQIVLVDRDVHSRFATETDTVFRKARLGWWAHRKLEKSVAKVDFPVLKYSPSDTGIFCEGGVVFTVRIRGEKTVLQETCRNEQPEADRAINRERNRVKNRLQEDLKKNGKKSDAEEFEKALAKFRKRMGNT